MKLAGRSTDPMPLLFTLLKMIDTKDEREYVEIEKVLPKSMTEKKKSDSRGNSKSNSSKSITKASSEKRSISRRSFLVGRPVPRARSVNPLILLISRISYCSFGVMFSMSSGTSFAPTRFCAALSTLKEQVIGDFFTFTISPSRTMCDGLALRSPMEMWPFLQASAAMLRVL